MFKLVIYWIIFILTLFAGIITILVHTNSMYAVIIFGLVWSFLFMFFYFREDPRQAAAAYFLVKYRDIYSTSDWKSLKIRGKAAALTARLYKWDNLKNTNVQAALWNVKLKKEKKGWEVTESRISNEKIR